jgi:hypothetical protein
MTFSLEYHIPVRHSIPASVAFLLLIGFSAAFISTSHAQINGTPASVTSPGFGGRAINGPPASVTSVGPRGFAPNAPVAFSPTHVPHTSDIHRHRHHSGDFVPPVAYAVPIPYAVDMGPGENDDAQNDGGDDDRDPNYQGGPTIFDRRGSGASSYVPPVNNVPRPHAAQSADDPSPDPAPPQAQTLLIFKDGRKLELGNYAIIGQTLFDLTPGHSRKVALADLDLDATQKQNDDRGVSFQIPPASQAD